jgi:hypothetical protein
MKNHRSAPLRHHRCSGRDREGDQCLRAQQGCVQGRACKATKPQIKEAVEKLFDVKVKSVNTLRAQAASGRSSSGRFGLQSM